MHGELSDCQDFTVRTDEYQGGAITTLVIHHAKNEDRGTYSLQAENRSVCHHALCSITFDDSLEMERRRSILT